MAGMTGLPCRQVLRNPRRNIALAKSRLEVLQIYRLLQWIHKGDKAQIEKLLKRGMKNLINLTEPREGMGALHLAVIKKNDDLVDYLLSFGAHPDVQDMWGRTPIMLAAELGEDEILSLLLQSQPDMKLVDKEGKGVLFYCNYPTNCHARCLKLALKNHADPNNVSAKGLHVLKMMCEKADERTPLCLILLDAGANPDAADEGTGMTALMEAARVGSLQVVREILRRGGNPNALDRRRNNAVHYAAKSGCFEVIPVLSAFAADFSVINMDHCTALHYAAATGSASSCKFLAQRGCNPKVKNEDDLLPRQIAKASGHKAAAKELRKAERQYGKGKKPHGKGKEQHGKGKEQHGKGKGADSSTLMSSLVALTLHDWSNESEAELQEAFGEQLGTVDAETFMSVLVKLNAPVEPDQLQMIISAHNKTGEGKINVNDFIKGVKYIKKAFRLSAFMPHKLKREKGVKGGKKKTKGEFVPPLPICTLVPELQARRPDGGPPHFMIEKYGNISDTLRFDADHPPLHPIVNDSWWYITKQNKIYTDINYCVRNLDLESLDLAFSQGVPVDTQDEFYKTPLMEACSSGNYEVAQYLLSKGADVNLCDQFLWTPLHHAANAGHLEIMELLVKAGAAVNAKALSDGTPLMRAIQSSRFACVEFLIKAGARVDAENKKGQNCLEMAIKFGDPQIVQLIQDKMDSLTAAKSAKAKAAKAKQAKQKTQELIEIDAKHSLVDILLQIISCTAAQQRGRAVESEQLQKEEDQALRLQARTAKVAITEGGVQSKTTSGTPGRTPTQIPSQNIVLHNSMITAGKTNRVDISFVPKTVWGEPPNSSQLMSNIERRKERLTLEVGFDDLLIPVSQRFQTRILEIIKPKTQQEESQRQRQLS